MKVIFNASPLIYLGKKRRIDLLKTLFEKIIISSEVEEEIMKLSKSPEAVQLREAIEDGWILVKRASEDETDKIAKLFSEIDEGEASVIALAIEQKTENVIIDDAGARIAAEYFKLKAYGTLYIMLEALKRNILKSKAEARSIVDNMLRRGFYLSTEVYAKFLYLLDKIN